MRMAEEKNIVKNAISSKLCTTTYNCKEIYDKKAINLSDKQKDKNKQKALAKQKVVTFFTRCWLTFFIHIMVFIPPLYE